MCARERIDRGIKKVMVLKRKREAEKKDTFSMRTSYIGKIEPPVKSLILRLTDVVEVSSPTNFHFGVEFFQ